MSRLTMITIIITVIGAVSILGDYVKDQDDKEEKLKEQLYVDFLREISEIDFEGPRDSYNDSCHLFLKNNSYLDTIIISPKKENIWGRDIWTTSGHIIINSKDGEYWACHGKNGWFACKKQFLMATFPLKEMGKILLKINSNDNSMRKDKVFGLSGLKRIIYPFDVLYDFKENKNLFKKLNSIDLNGIERLIKDIILGNKNPLKDTAGGVPLYEYIPREYQLRYNVIEAWRMNNHISDDEFMTYLKDLKD
jgi:hypothetical protein